MRCAELLMGLRVGVSFLDLSCLDELILNQQLLHSLGLDFHNGPRTLHSEHSFNFIEGLAN